MLRLLTPYHVRSRHLICDGSEVLQPGLRNDGEAFGVDFAPPGNQPIARAIERTGGAKRGRKDPAKHTSAPAKAGMAQIGFQP
ncbi:hypothetical protein SAMN05216387_10273 [Nitrosovibrio tenuis]|uniref:Uncharacterized protein n=1 Tax=Nitrosovibrio tenuis TaxID=1233 RepID=A0A1H7I8I5_9PROT|nr:hypothetical protein SAMN05216387_10273 [Nitrosovibrio tenuis]